MLRITTNPALLTEKLIEIGWEPMHIQLIGDRISALAENGETFVDVARRLNPTKPVSPAWEPSPLIDPRKNRTRTSKALSRS